MLSHGLQSLFTDIPLTAAGLLLFVAAHTAIVTRLFLRNSDGYAADANLPLEKDGGDQQ